LDADTAGGIALWISIYQERALFGSCERGCEVHCGRRLSDTAFLIGDSYDSGQLTECTWRRERSRNLRPSDAGCMISLAIHDPARGRKLQLRDGGMFRTGNAREGSAGCPLCGT